MTGGADLIGLVRLPGGDPAFPPLALVAINSLENRNLVPEGPAPNGMVEERLRISLPAALVEDFLTALKNESGSVVKPGE